MIRSMSKALLSKYKGSLVGAVLGDCIGAEFEGHWAESIAIDKITKLISTIENEAKKSQHKIWEYTDDTAMARSVARSLIEEKGFNAHDMAKKFTEEYYKEPERGYGAGVTTVFKKLKKCNYQFPFKAAEEQFDGSGSYGNGGAMRISPAPLFALYNNDYTKIAELTENITRITHSHRNAINGAILESLAIDLALRCDCKVDVNNFISELQRRMKPVEAKSLELLKEKSKPDSDSTSEEADLSHPYCDILEKVRDFSNQEDTPDSKHVAEVLGTDIAALKSVPAAVFSFLRASQHEDHFKGHNPFERTIMLSMSLGGDTDTIATMAAAISGACYGVENIPKSWMDCCEGVTDALQFAEDLYNLQDTLKNSTN